MNSSTVPEVMRDIYDEAMDPGGQNRSQMQPVPTFESWQSWPSHGPVMAQSWPSHGSLLMSLDVSWKVRLRDLPWGQPGDLDPWHVWRLRTSPQRGKKFCDLVHVSNYRSHMYNCITICNTWLNAEIEDENHTVLGCSWEFLHRSIIVRRYVGTACKGTGNPTTSQSRPLRSYFLMWL